MRVPISSSRRSRRSVFVPTSSATLPWRAEPRAVQLCVILRVMVKRRVLGASVALVLVLGSCSGGGTTHTTSPTTTRGAQRALAVAVSACEQAMVTVATEKAQTDEPTTFAHQKATLHACHSRAAWLAAAARHSSTGGQYTTSYVGRCATCNGEKPKHALSRWCANQSETACK